MLIRQATCKWECAHETSAHSTSNMQMRMCQQYTNDNAVDIANQTSTTQTRQTLQDDIAMGWLRLVRSFKLQLFIAKEPYERDQILQKRTIILRSLLIVATSQQNPWQEDIATNTNIANSRSQLQPNEIGWHGILRYSQMQIGKHKQCTLSRSGGPQIDQSNTKKSPFQKKKKRHTTHLTVATKVEGRASLLPLINWGRVSACCYICSVYA